MLPVAAFRPKIISMRSAFMLLACTLLGATACIVEAPSGEKHAESQRAVAPKAPPLSVTSGANLGGKVEIVGATIQPGQILPGDPVKVSVVLNVLDRLDKDYMVFVHVEDADARMDRMNVDHRPIGGTYPTTLWKKGETLKDDFQIYLPPGSRSRGLLVWIGFWEPVSDTRIPLKNPETVRNDGRDRILLARIPVGE